MISPFYDMIHVMGRVSMADQSNADNCNAERLATAIKKYLTEA